MDRVRFNEATRLPLNPNIPIVEITYHLGYADPANFTRAFKRWTGVSPSGFRQKAVQIGPRCTHPIDSGSATSTVIELFGQYGAVRLAG